MLTPIRLDDAHQTLVLTPTEGLPVLAYWGPRLPDCEDLGQLAAAGLNDLNGGMLDKLAPLTLCPVGDGVFQGQPAVELADTNGAPLVPRFTVSTVTATEGACTIEALDAALGLTYQARFALVDGVVEMSSDLLSVRPIRLRWLAAPVLPVPQHLAEVIEF